MNFQATLFKEAHVIEREPFQDFRGSFARVFCVEEFKKHGLEYEMVQSNLSVTHHKGTIRGMHYQVEGSEEDKLVMCFSGAILDVIIDIRKTSATFGKNFMVELTGINNKMLFVPKGFAHGFLTLTDHCSVFYQVSNFYNSAHERGIRWNDPFFKINWPITNPIVSDKDSRSKDFVL
jgi:dTDP-4-dehydrorhamnose 3,5-epimerase